MVQLGDEHCRNAAENRTFLLLDGGQDKKRIKLFHRNNRRTMRDHRHHAEDQPETVEEGHAEAESVGVGELQVLPDGETVVEDVVMGQHDPLREAGGPRRILHIDDFLAVQ